MTLPPSSAIQVEGISKRYRRQKNRGAGMPLPSLVPPPLRRRKKREAAAPSVREVWALRDVSFDVGAGSVLGIIGANGAGKTTLLKVLARVSPPTSGVARVRGRVVPLLEVGAGFQPDNTGRENIYLHGDLYGIPRPVVRRRIDDIVGFAGVEELIDQPVKTYSSGMYLRLGFSLAINMDPDVLLADEVLAVGDLTFQEQCLRRVEESARGGLTVLFVSHDMAAIRRLCDRVIWLNAGQIVKDGNPAEVVTAYEEASWALVDDDAGSASHATEHGTLLPPRLLSSDGTEIGAVKVSEPVTIQTRLRLNKPGWAIRCLVTVKANGVVAFRSVQPDVHRVTKAGMCVANVEIPPHLLADTVYTVKVGVFLNRKGLRTRLVRDNALNFRVFDTAERSSARGTFKGPLPGAVRPRLEWSVGGEEKKKKTAAA